MDKIINNIPTEYLEKMLQRGGKEISFIGKLSREASNYFGESFQIIVELYVDPEIKDLVSVLLLIRTHEYQEGIMSKIEKFRGPFYKEMIDLNFYVLITTDFQEPI